MVAPGSLVWAARGCRLPQHHTMLGSTTQCNWHHTNAASMCRRAKGTMAEKHEAGGTHLHGWRKWLVDNKLRAVGAHPVQPISAALGPPAGHHTNARWPEQAYQWTKPIPTQMKIIHARVYAQVRAWRPGACARLPRQHRRVPPPACGSKPGAERRQRCDCRARRSLWRRWAWRASWTCTSTGTTPTRSGRRSVPSALACLTQSGREAPASAGRTRDCVR